MKSPLANIKKSLIRELKDSHVIYEEDKRTASYRFQDRNKEIIEKYEEECAKNGGHIPGERKPIGDYGSGADCVICGKLC